ncbi:tRNA pseudouridine(55) synthase TruB [Pseudazoarcus pumilus]|uniref:tRNA pseudouridine(55) synthase TruB n=1 Tax=Pseudazoarcus pumilus TaxID=2067960 RepID=UPI0015708E9F|nr:tRNA pseudouridine(55) synthase TruB [Pseudazoarcus pumilus]
MNRPPRRIPRERIDGVLLLDKPQGLSSNGALQAAKRLLNAAKAGHTGTLDPLATGLLPLTFGEATKFSQTLLDADKEYEATIRLGFETDSGDAEGSIVSTASVAVGAAALESALEPLRGEIEQIPPMHSALKRDGKPLYEYARAGIEIERAPRRVSIHRLDVLAFEGTDVRVSVRCSKGTYIRSLAIDLGRALGCGAHLSALRRTAIGPFGVADALTLDALEAESAPTRRTLLAPPDRLLACPSLELEDGQAQAILQGRALHAASALAGPVRLHCRHRFLGLGEVGPDGTLRARRLVAADPAEFAPHD